MITPTNYRYAMNIKLSNIGGTPPTQLFPNIEDMVISSREFDKFEEAVTSVNSFVTEVVITLNQSANLEKYKMISEVNPRFTGKETISKDWASNEVSKIWIIDKIKQEVNTSSAILAVALAQLLEVPGEPVSLN